MNRHLIGLLLGAEEDWPQAFEAITLGWVRSAIKVRTTRSTPSERTSPRSTCVTRPGSRW